MGFLANLYQRAKKKISDWLSPVVSAVKTQVPKVVQNVEQNVGRGLSNLYNQAQNYVRNYPQNYQQSFANRYVAPKINTVVVRPIQNQVKKYFTPVPGQLRTRDVIRELPSEFKPSKVWENFLNVPRFDIGSKSKNPVVKFGGAVASGFLNPAINYKDFMREAHGQYTGKRPYNLKKLGGMGLESGLDLGTMLVGGKAVPQMAKSAMERVAPKTIGGLSKMIAKEAWRGSKIAGRIGAGYGLAESLKNEANLRDTLKNVGTGYAGGRVLGAGLGFGATAGPALAKAGVGSLAGKMFKTASKYPYFTKTAREVGRSIPEFSKKLPAPGLTIKDVSGGKSSLADDFAKEVKPLSEYQKRGQKIVQKGIQNIEEKLKMPQYSSEDVNRLAGEAQYGIEQRFSDFKNAFSRWIGEREAAKTKAMQEAGSIGKVPQELAPDVIKSIENPSHKVSPQVKPIIQQFRNKFDELYKSAKDAGIDIGYLKNYITHIWEQPQAQVEEMYKTAKKSFPYASPRTVPTYEEGIKIGLTPRFTNPAQILAEYARKLEQVKANVNFLNSLRKSGLVVDASIGSKQAGFSPINATGFTRSISKGPDGATVIGNFYAPNEIAKIINRVFSPEDAGLVGKTLVKTGNLSSRFQDIYLSGGIPKTPVNAWTFAQMTKEVLSGRVKSPLASAFRALSQNRSNEFFAKNAGQIEKMQLRNVPISTSWNLDSLADNGFIKNTLGDKWSKVWDKIISEPTFQRFMPMLQINLFNDIERKAMAKGLLPEEAADVAARAVRNFYGLTGTDVSAQRSQIGKDILKTFTFAPHYREAMLKFWANNVKALGHPLSLENQANARFLVGAGITLGAMDWLNYKFNGKHMWENPRGTEDKLLIPLPNGTTIGIPLLSSIATLPRLGFRSAMGLAKGDVSGTGKDIFQTTVSAMIKPFADVIANRDYFGNEIVEESDTAQEKYKKMGKYIGAQLTGHPYVRAFLQSAGKSPFQVISEAVESPLRFYKQKKLEAREYYEKLDEAKASLKNPIDRKAWDLLHAPSKDLEGKYIKQPSVWDSAAKATLLLQHPEVLAAETKLNRELAQEGKNVDPFYTDLTPLQQQIFLTYKTLPPQDPQKKNLELGNPWIKDLKKKQTEFFASLPESNPNKPAEPIPYPEPTPSVKKKVDVYFSLADSKQKAKFLSENQDVVDQLAAIDEYNRAIRAAKNLPQYDKYPAPSPELKKVIDYYNSLPKGTGDRSAWIKANPKLWKEMQTYYLKASLFGLQEAAQQAAFQNTGFDSEGLKDIKNLADYDIAVTTDENGNKIYSLAPGANFGVKGYGGGYGGYRYYRKSSKKKTAKKSGGKTPKTYVIHPRRNPELSLSPSQLTSAPPRTGKRKIVLIKSKKKIKPRKFIVKLGSKTMTV